MRLARSFSDDNDVGEGEERGEECRGGFRLVNYDLNPSNVLVDNEFNVLGVIDWDSVMALPDAALHRLPMSMGMEIARPGITETCALQKSRCALGHGFTQIAEKQAREGEEESVFRFTAEGFYTREAVAYRSLIDVQKRDGLEELAKFYQES
ncbi:hypothetical protein NLG97_g11061 [Lecanicillium saksenae]|uniref:Uncharacterized protein n=1 Tax=Lecanicillium saksenae TaxID=468837 RepID=A0ACC1QCU5_9HYPO|nr:hypothetical protein NLG97_g11061 [Lecanicillium saksenae]